MIRKCAIVGLFIAIGFAPFEAIAAGIFTDRIGDEPADIWIVGDIEPGDAARFDAEAAKVENADAVVRLVSNGGLVVEAIEIGEIVRRKRFATAVVKNAVCDSACGLIWLAGLPRGLHKSARVGFHAAYVKHGNGVSESGVANAIVGRYLTLLNLPERMVIFVTSPPPEKLNWITTANYSRLGIEVTVMGQALSTKPRVSPSTPPEIWRFGRAENGDLSAEVTSEPNGSTKAALSIFCNEGGAYSVLAYYGAEEIADPVARNVLEQTGSSRWSAYLNRSWVETYRDGKRTARFEVNGFHRGQGDSLTPDRVRALSQASYLLVRTDNEVLRFTGEGSAQSISKLLSVCPLK